MGSEHFHTLSLNLEMNCWFNLVKLISWNRSGSKRGISSGMNQMRVISSLGVDMRKSTMEATFKMLIFSVRPGKGPKNSPNNFFGALKINK